MELFEAAVETLSGPDLAELIGALGREARQNGPVGLLLGVCLSEAVKRLQTQDGKTQDSREEKEV
jgi:hypothetical protein